MIKWTPHLPPCWYVRMDGTRVRSDWILLSIVAALPPVPCLAYPQVLYFVVWGGLHPLQILHEHCPPESMFVRLQGDRPFSTVLTRLWCCYSSALQAELNSDCYMLEHHSSFMSIPYSLHYWISLLLWRKYLPRSHLGRKGLFQLQFKWIQSVLFRKAWRQRRGSCTFGFCI